MSQPAISDTEQGQSWRPHDAAPGSGMSAHHVADLADGLHAAVTSVIQGKDAAVGTALAVLLAGGHLLIEDVPGVGKTMLSRAIARAIHASVRRVQFTPDLFPSDLTGVSIYNQDTHEFTFKPGPVFANILIGDEVNRASPKTQSALLECMEEQTVSVDGTTYRLDSPFMVVATQNPLALQNSVEREGTHPLPEAQRDRFMARLSLGYPSLRAESEMLGRRQIEDPLEKVIPVTNAAEIVAAQRMVHSVYASEAVRDYVVSLVAATREHSRLRLGASPRASLHLLRAAQSWAAISRRDHVLPDDIQALMHPVLAHRLIPLGMGQSDVSDVIDDILGRVPVASRVL